MIEHAKIDNIWDFERETNFMKYFTRSDFSIYDPLKQTFHIYFPWYWLSLLFSTRATNIYLSHNDEQTNRRMMIAQRWHIFMNFAIWNLLFLEHPQMHVFLNTSHAYFSVSEERFIMADPQLAEFWEPKRFWKCPFFWFVEVIPYVNFYFLRWQQIFNTHFFIWSMTDSHSLTRYLELSRTRIVASHFRKYFYQG